MGRIKHGALVAEAKNIHAEERVREIRHRLATWQWNVDQDAPSLMNGYALDDLRWLLAENDRLRRALLIYTAVRH